MPEDTTGYVFGIFDLFNIAHLDTVRLAAAECDRLVVGVATDELVDRTCGVRPFVPAIERVEIVSAVGLIAEVHVLDSLDLPVEAAGCGADVIFLPGGDLDVIQLAADLPALPGPSGNSAPEIWPASVGIRVTQLPTPRRTASSQVRTALAGTTTRSSVA